MITKEQIARAYALMECERAPNKDAGYGYYPAQKTASLFLERGLITQGEWIKFMNNEYPHSDRGPFSQVFLDLFALYEHQNPLPAGQRYSIDFPSCFPVVNSREEKSWTN